MSWKKPKVLRKSIKDYKRILHLMYRKGMLDRWMDNHIHWAAYRSFNHTLNHNHLYFIEPHFWTHQDYWGESDQYELICRVFEDHLWKEFGDGEWNDESEKAVIGWFCHHKTNKQRINYLKQLPTKRCDNQINKLLIIDFKDF